MFGRRSSDDSATAAAAAVTTTDASGATDSKAGSSPKGRPTPTRKEAEAARKQSLRVPRDPKAAKAAERERSRELRQKQMEAMRGGDERYLPARDQGEVRKFARDWVDARFQLASMFLPLAVIILLTGFIKLNPHAQQIVRNIEAVLLVAMLLTLGVTYFLAGRALKQRYPDAADRKGAAFYATMRSAMPRRLRQPRPTVTVGGKPVQPKAPKASKDAK